MIKSGNPALGAETFNKVQRTPGITMTIQGAVNKSMMLLILLVCGAGYAWHEAASSEEAFRQMAGYLIPLLIAGLVIALVTVFFKKFSPYTAPFYAVIEGVLLGIISLMAEMRFPGIVMQAVGLTMGVFFSLLIAYKSRMIKATENFKLGVAAATGGIFVIYLVSFVLGFFGMNIPYIHESGLIGIGFSLFVVVIAALNLVLDFDFIEQGAASGAPKYMEWYSAFGLLVTLIWLYIEILNLLMKLRGRD